jgi:hypothetical protein
MQMEGVLYEGSLFWEHPSPQALFFFFSPYNITYCNIEWILKGKIGAPSLT